MLLKLSCVYDKIIKEIIIKVRSGQKKTRSYFILCCEVYMRGKE